MKKRKKNSIKKGRENAIFLNICKHRYVYTIIDLRKQFF